MAHTLTWNQSHPQGWGFDSFTFLQLDKRLVEQAALQAVVVGSIPTSSATVPWYSGLLHTPVTGETRVQFSVGWPKIIHKSQCDKHSGFAIMLSMETTHLTTDDLLFRAEGEQELPKKRGYLNVLSQRTLDERQKEIYTRISQEVRKKFYSTLPNGNNNG